MRKKLNLARARMLAADGSPTKAVEAWLDGVRMALHLSADGILISDLVACSIFNVATYGIVGVKVTIFKGEVLRKDHAPAEPA